MEWKNYKLKDCIEFIVDNRGKTPPLDTKGYEIIETNAISGNEKFPNYNKVNKFVNENIYRTWFRKGHPQKDDILISTVGDIGNVAIMNNNRGCIAQNLIALRTNKEILHPEFLYYFLTQTNIQYKLKALNIGSVQPSLKVPHLLEIDIPLPKLEEQILIIDKLSKLDEKIALNIQTNQTLEQIAQTIFKSWFIDFDPVKAKATALAEGKTAEQANLAAMATLSGKAIETLSPEEYQQLWDIANAFPSEMVENEEFGEVPKGWRLGSLADICSMRNGYAFKSNEWTESGIPVIKIGSIQSTIVNVFGNGYVSEDNLIKHPEFILQGGDIVIGQTGAYVGKVGRIPADSIAILNQRVAKFEPKEYFYRSYIFCMTTRSIFRDFVVDNAQGSAQPNISTKDILQFPVVIASDELFKIFETLVSNSLSKILFNAKENLDLEKLRNELLPKLLSGVI